jgi:hypothetical protein
MSMRVLALVIVYGTAPLQTTSLQTLLASKFDHSRLRILVWDNSKAPAPHAEELDALGVGYVSTPDNLALSMIYNRVIANHLQQGEHLLLLDQDSKLPPDFLSCCDATVTQNDDVDLFLPMIHANGNWVSPLTYIAGWGRYWKEPRVGRMPARETCAINSGMLISSRYLKGEFPGYDERLRFYGTDTQFMLDYMDRRRELVVLDVRFDHDLSFFSDHGADRAGKFRTMRAAYRHIYEGRPIWQRCGVATVMVLVSLVYAIRLRDPTVLWPSP